MNLASGYRMSIIPGGLDYIVLADYENAYVVHVDSWKSIWRNVFDQESLAGVTSAP